ncbi:MAG: hypothetical protein ACXVA9_08070, partial [Bdellovibrionales bacterium]
MTLLTLLTLAASVACTRNSQEEGHGGQDGGGGHVQKSTTADVRAAITQSIRLATESNMKVNIFASFWKDFGHNSIKDQAHVFPAIVKKGHWDLHDINLRLIDEFTDSDFKSPFLDALKTNRWTIKEEGDCGNAKDNHADASVSAFNVNGDICISAGNLTRLPPSALLKEILGLLLHETSHLGGANEAEAQNWQTVFAEYYAARFGSLSETEVLDRTLVVFSKVKLLMHDASKAD